MPSGNGHTPTISRKYRICDRLNTFASATRPASSSPVFLASNFELSDTAPAMVPSVRAIYIVFALALSRWYELRVKPRTILVGHLQREYGATIGRHPEAKAQPARKLGKVRGRRIARLRSGRRVGEGRAPGRYGQSVNIGQSAFRLRLLRPGRWLRCKRPWFGPDDGNKHHQHREDSVLHARHYLPCYTQTKCRAQAPRGSDRQSVGEELLEAVGTVLSPRSGDVS